LDAPVTGGVTGADSGNLTFMVGGRAEILRRVEPLLDAMGSKVVHVGACGSGQTAKQCNQIAVAGILLGMTEALCHADANGVDIVKISDILDSGTASSMLIKSLRGRLMQTGDKATFSIAQFIKDLTVASEAAANNGEQLLTVDSSLQYLENIDESGGGDAGLQVLLQYYKRSRTA